MGEMEKTNIFSSNVEDSDDLYHGSISSFNLDKISKESSTLGSQSHLLISEAFEYQSLETVEALADTIMKEHKGVGMIFILGDDKVGKTSLANTLKLQLSNSVIISDSVFSEIKYLTNTVSAMKSDSTITIFDGMTIESFDVMNKKERMFCAKDLIEGVCRSAGIIKVLIEVKRVENYDCSSIYQKSPLNENGYIFYNIVK